MPLSFAFLANILGFMVSAIDTMQIPKLRVENEIVDERIGRDNIIMFQRLLINRNFWGA
jgi:hypothetical protein